MMKVVVANLEEETVEREREREIVRGEGKNEELFGCRM